MQAFSKHFGWLFFLILITSCTQSTNNSSIPLSSEETKLAVKPDVCKPSTNTKENLNVPTTTVGTQEIDSNFENYIVKFKETPPRLPGNQPSHLQPSGRTQREFDVVALNINLIHGTTYSFKISGTPSEKKQKLRNLTAQTDVDFIEPDYPISVAPTEVGQTPPDDPGFSKQWFHKILNSILAWQINEGSEDIVAAIVDTGIDYTHPDLQDNAWVNKGEILNGLDDDSNGYIDDIHGWNFSANTNDARSTTLSPHGTHVAGLVGASGNNHLGVVGVSQKVKLMALKFMDDSGSGMTSNAIRAINYAIDKNVFLINNSWGSNMYSKALADAIARAAQAGILFFAAAGNGSKGIGYDIDSTPWYPASYASWNVFSVAATNSSDEITRFSNFSHTKVDVAAPGFSIFSTIPGNNYEMMSGTSMATPITAGLAVLIKATNTKIEPFQVLSVLRASTDKVAGLKDKTISGGRINSYKAVQLAQAMKLAPNCVSN